MEEKKWILPAGSFWLFHQRNLLFKFEEIVLTTQTKAVVVGETGCGKSSFVKWLSDFEDHHVFGIDQNDDIIDLASTSDNRLSTVYIRQDPYKAFHPYISLESHFKDLLAVKESKQIHSFEEVIDLLIKLKINQPRQLLRRRIDQISLGEAQRCSLILGLIKQTDFLFIDEITAHLDEDTALTVLTFIDSFCRIHGLGVWLISHKPEQTLFLGADYYQIEGGSWSFFEPRGETAVALEPAKRYPDKNKSIQVKDLKIDLTHGGVTSLDKGLYFDSFQIPLQAIWGVRGRSGSGKSSLMMALMGERVTSGEEVLWGDVKLKSFSSIHQKFRMRYLPQSVISAFNPVQLIYTSLIDIAQSHRWTKKKAEDEIANWLLKLDLDPILLNSQPHEVSGGQIQRMGILSLFLSHPEMLILDESFSAIDTYTRDKIWPYVKNYCKDNNIGIILISHDGFWVQEEADFILEIEQVAKFY